MIPHLHQRPGDGDDALLRGVRPIDHEQECVAQPLLPVLKAGRQLRVQLEHGLAGT